MANQANQESRARTAQIIRDRKDSILKDWVKSVRGLLPVTRDEETPRLINSMPEFLDKVADALDPASPLEIATDDNRIAARHAENRLDFEGFDVRQLMWEYRLLWRVLIEHLNAEGAASLPVLEVLTTSIETALIDAAATYVDLSERRRWESELEFRQLVHEVKDYAIFMIDPEGRIMSWNEGAERIKQWKAEEVEGENYRLLFRPEDRLERRPERNIDLALEVGRHVDQWWRLKKDGTAFWADVTMTAMYDSGGKLMGFSLVVHDLTIGKRVEEELRAAKEAAESASQLKTAFLANMSHEIRTPLGAILGFAELLKEPGIRGRERSAYVETIDRNGKSLVRLIDDILDISKVEAGCLEFEIIESPIRPLISDVAHLFEVRSKKKGIHFQLDIAPEVPEHVWTDPTRLRQILNNILGNAVKFTSAGQVRLRVDYEASPLHSSKSSPRLILTVRDTGPGIPVAQRARLFEPFTQADISTTRRFGGSGLGLNLSRQLARQLGGDVTLVDCPQEVGCTFRVVVSDQNEQRKGPSPAASGRPDLRPVEAIPKQTPEGGGLSGLNILLVEDSPDNQILIRRLLTRAGASVEIAANGAEGVKKALTKTFDVVLMDIQMPVLDGNDATRKLRASGYKAPIIALTAHAMLEEREKSLAAGCMAHLSKPVDSAELQRTILRLAKAHS